MGACLLGFAAGALGTLSPCVLPLLPLVVAGAVERHRFGPVVLAAGLALSATAVGFAVALLGFTLDRDLLRLVAGALLVVVGAMLLITRLDLAFALADRKSTRLNSSHVRISYAVFCLKKKKNTLTLFSSKKKKIKK